MLSQQIKKKNLIPIPKDEIRCVQTGKYLAPDAHRFVDVFGYK